LPDGSYPATATGSGYDYKCNTYFFENKNATLADGA